MEENNLSGILDNRILRGAKKEEIIVVANLVKRCLSMNGKKRPTMKEVAMELELVQMLRKDFIPVQNYEEVEIVRTDQLYGKCDAINLYLKTKGTDIDLGSSLDSQPLGGYWIGQESDDLMAYDPVFQMENLGSKPPTPVV
ncbi:hypothetical protein F2P56_001230 [Juglans regia]|uniref:Uncharacterized protein n=1 Tax=Juglans regia TaxID=51240 RepID=A0A834D895_JUGRE|nr:hypothetical protein F2P56_001230 [Juglans regia]